MKKGINAWCFPSNFSMEDRFKLAKEQNYHGIELNMSEEASGLELTLDTDTESLSAIKELSKRYSMPVHSISTALHWTYPLTSNDVEKRLKGSEIVKKMIDAAAFLGADSVLVVPGLVTEDVSYFKAFERSITAFIELKDYAEDKDVSIGIENVWNKFLLSPLEMRGFIDDIGSPKVGAYFDAGNVVQFSFPEHWVEVLSDKIVKVHVKDFDTSIGNITGFKTLLQGSLNWQALVKALRNVGYDGFLTAELFPYKTNPVQLVDDTSRALDYIISL